MLPEIFRSRHPLFPSREDMIDRFFSGLNWETGAYNPRTDIRETDTDIVVEMDLPGLKKDEVKVELKDKVLTISGERKRETKTEKETYQSVERTWGRFERSFVLPDTIETDKISAKAEEGVLTVTVPKSAKALPKEIAVEVK